MYPIKLKPAFKDYLWGGTRLRDDFGKDCDFDKIAESWELSCHKDGNSVVADGEFAGLTLAQYIEKEGKSVLGTNCAKAMQRAHKRIKEFFDICRVYQAHIPTYPSGHWLFGFASKTVDPLKFDADRWNALGIKTRYYNTDLHKGCFAIPNYVKELLDNAT